MKKIVLKKYSERSSVEGYPFVVSFVPDWPDSVVDDGDESSFSGGGHIENDEWYDHTMNSDYEDFEVDFVSEYDYDEDALDQY